MAQKVASDDNAKLRAKVRQLEAALERERDSRRKLEGSKTASRSYARDSESRRKGASTDRDHDRVWDSETSRRVADSTSRVSRSMRDAKSRMVRGVTLGALEGFRAWSDALTSFADGVLHRNEGRDRSVRDLLGDLPGDIASGFSDAVDDLIDVPARVSDRYSRSYREGEESDRKRTSRSRHDSDSSDLDDDHESDRDHGAHSHSDDEGEGARTAEFSVRAESTKDAS